MLLRRTVAPIGEHYIKLAGNACELLYILCLTSVTMEQHALKNVNNCLNTNI